MEATLNKALEKGPEAHRWLKEMKKALGDGIWAAKIAGCHSDTITELEWALDNVNGALKIIDKILAANIQKE